jgi:hypothetical protein
MLHRQHKLIPCAVLLASAVFAQDSQPLGNIARRLLAEKPKSESFSADFSVIRAGENDKTTGRWHFAWSSLGSKVRIEIFTRNDSVVTILDNFTRTSYLLIPRERKYLEIHGYGLHPGAQVYRDLMHLQSQASADPCIGRPRATCKDLGPETVHGHNCEKWEVADEYSGKRTVWIDQKSYLPLRQKDSAGEIEFTNIKEEPQAATLFVVPAEYERLAPPVFVESHDPSPPN